MGIILPFQGYSSLLMTSSLNTECGETTRETGCLSGLGFSHTCIGYILIVSKEELLQSMGTGGIRIWDFATFVTGSKPLY